ncbi:MAG TPA: hypothetical protein VF613_07440, partial [Longimicrobium sp.]
TDLPPAEEEVGDARAAVEEPAEETQARAGDQLVAALGERPAPSPEIEELCEHIYQVIRDKRPPDEDSLVEADPQEMAQEAGGEMNAAVEGDTRNVQGQYDQLQEQPEGAPAAEPMPLVAPPAGAPPPDLAADAAAPAGVAPEAVSLDADVAASQQQMADAGMDSEPAQLVESGPIADARAAQGELTETAARDPQEVLAEQQATLAGAQADMAALQASALQALQGSREGTTTAGAAQQGEMVGSEEQMRTQAAAEAQRLFDDAQTRVSGLLDPLPATAMARWEAGVQVLSTEFDQHLARVKAWVEERHESTTLAVLDYFTGLPDWVTEEYDDAEQAFGDGVCNLIREISRDVNGVIAACEAIVDDSRAQIAAVFEALPDSLDGWAAEQQAQFGERLNGLQERAQQTRSDFTRDLTQRAGQAVQDVRARVHELREAAKGLIGRIADAVNAFLDDPARFIIDGLLSLLGIAPASFWAVVDKIGAAIDSIADDPMNFVNNLMAAVGQGFSQFFDKIGTHLLQGLLDWLFSGLGSVGVAIPADTSLKSIITFFLQLMGLSWANIRKILAKHVGEENVALIEQAWELISSLIELGPEGLFELIKEQLDPANLLQMVLDAAVEYLVQALIEAVTPRILLLFNPAGAILQAIEAIFRVLKWIFENAARIFTLVETIVNGVTDLIAGNISGMANAVEGALARLIPPVIDFLAGYLGLGGLPEAIAGVIEGFQERVLGIVDRVIGFLVEKARGLLKKLGLGGEDEEPEEEPTGVKGAVKQDLEGRIGGSFESVEEARSAIQGAYQAHQGEGLVALDVELNSKGKFDIYATASPKTLIIGDVPYTIDPDTDKQQLIDLSMQLNPAVSTTSILVGVNGVTHPSSPVQSRPGQTHADVVFVDNHLPAIAAEARQRFEETGDRTTVSMTLNRNPCSNCAPAIGAAQRAHGQYIQFSVFFAGPWAKFSEFADQEHLQPDAHERVVGQIMTLLESGVDVGATQVWDFFTTHHFHGLVKRVYGPRNQIKETVVQQLIGEARQRVDAQRAAKEQIDDVEAK